MTFGIKVAAFGLAFAFTAPAVALGAPPLNESIADPDVSSVRSEDRDADEYARLTGVTLAEAQYRLSLQETIGRLGETLEERESDFAGLYIDHAPVYSIVVQMASKDSSVAERYVAGGPLDGLVRVEQVEFPLSSLQADADYVLSNLAGEHSVMIDVRVNKVIIEVLSVDDFESSAKERAFTFPASAEVAVVAHLPTPALNLYGGLALSDCTSGFTISKSGSRAITTAGHCSDTQSYAGNALTYQNDEVRSGSYDSQSHKKSGAAYLNRVNIGGGNVRSITSKRYRVNENVGDLACKYGKTTGYGCGWIVSKYATPCGGVGTPTLSGIKVDSDPNGTGYDLSEPGDSGGPWFVSSTALGTMSCHQGFDAIYVATDYIEDGLNATILTSP